MDWFCVKINKSHTTVRGVGMGRMAGGGGGWNGGIGGGGMGKSSEDFNSLL